MNPSVTSIYVHIPFCQQKCRYCDFVSYAGAEALQQPYIAALCRDITGRGGIFTADGVVIESVFIGGGTPSCLSGGLLRQLLRTLQTLPLLPEAEISIEANPGTVDSEKLALLRECGVNRLSLGVQSFDDQVLKNLGRIHTSAEAERAVGLARAAGFTNINLDLMHSLPGQTLPIYEQSLKTAAGLGVEHISAYSLILEENTPLAKMIDGQQLSLPDEDTDAAMFDLTHDYLTAHGYEHYEISNYAQAGRRCRHNLRYWQYHPYTGFGTAACSFDGKQRLTNTDDVAGYIEAITESRSPVEECEKLAHTTMMSEYVFLALRTADGVSEQDFSARFSTDFYAYYHSVLRSLMKEGLLIKATQGYRLTRHGLRFANRVFSAFLP